MVSPGKASSRDVPASEPRPRKARRGFTDGQKGASGTYRSSGRTGETSPRIRQALVAVAVVAILGIAGVSGAIAVHALGANATPAPNRLEIDSADSTTSLGKRFTVRVTQTTDVPTSGTQTTLKFDHTKLRIESVTWGSAFGRAVVRIPTAWPQTIEEANASGSLKAVTAALAAPNQVPAGTQVFLSIDFTAISCGQSRLDLPIGPTDATMLDGTMATYGNAIAVGTVGGTVSISC